MKKLIKITLVILLVLLLIPFIVSLFLENEKEIIKTIEIEKPAWLVYDYLRDLESQKAYSTFIPFGKHTKLEFEGIPKKIGSKMKWIIPNKEQGELTLSNLKLNEYIELTLEYKKPNSSKNIIFFKLSKSTESTTILSMGFRVKAIYPTNIKLLMWKEAKFFEIQLEKNLQTIKALLETVSSY